MNPELEETPELYQVNVVIIEGRHLAIKNASTKVNISLKKRKKTIHSKSGKTDCPYFNNFCTFLFRLPLKVLLDEILTIRIYEKSITKRFVGSFSVDLATIWSQPNHQFHHKWAVLVDPRTPVAGVRGFLKCDIAILTKGVVIKPPSDSEEDDLLEHNLLVPYGGTQDRHRTRVVLSIYRADSFSYQTETGHLKLIQPYIKITYGGSAGKTSVAKNKGPPIWNEELVFLDFFPPLTQNILVELFDRHKSTRKSLGNTNIEMHRLYEDGKDGFLPTYGPNFLYLYRPFKKLDRHRNFSTEQNSFAYVIRVLLALRTEVIHVGEELEKRKRRGRRNRILPKSIPPLLENSYFQYNKFILFAAIFDALIFDKYLGKTINIKVTLGPSKSSAGSPTKNPSKKKVTISKSYQEHLKYITVISENNRTPKLNSDIEGGYTFINFSGKYPCVHIYGEWPDSLRRMYRSNIIKNAIQNCKDEVNKIKYDLQFQTEKRSESSKKLKATFADLSKSCEVILLLTNVTTFRDTNLCCQRKVAYHREIAEIALNAKIASKQNALKAEDELRKISTYLARLTKYAQDPENSFPDTEVWLLRQNKTISQYSIQTEDVAFSEDFTSRGNMSGRIQTVLFRGKKGQIKAKLDIFVWFGLAEKFVECLKLLPPIVSNDHAMSASKIDVEIPTQLVYEEEHYFQLRAHILQGKILFGFDESGRADPYVRIIILGKYKKTQILKDTLSPVWDETLIVPNITLYGPSQHIKTNPLSITVELFDSETGRAKELVGRGFVTPIIKLKEDIYVPPKLKWESINSKFKEVAKLLLTMELLEISDNFDKLFPSGPSPLKIPDDIRPHNVRYRLEVLFWGVRQVKKNTLRNKVFVTLECGQNLITSPILHNFPHKLNFPGTVQFAELHLPTEPELAPPFSLNLYHIGSVSHKKVYVGTCFIPSVRYFLLQFMTASETLEEKNAQMEIMQKDAEKKKMKEEDRKQRRRAWRRRQKARECCDKCLFFLVKLYRHCKCKFFRKCQANAYELAPLLEEEDMTWWGRFFASETLTDEYTEEAFGLKIYHEELEAQPQFKKLQDFLRTFDLVTGHEMKKGRVVQAKVKAALYLYKWSPADETKFKSNEGFLSNVHSNAPLQFILRVYVIRCLNLPSKDLYGTSDPYIYIELGKHRVNDRESYQPKQVNPTFGKCYEFKGTFPHDYLLRIKILDYDSTSHDDLIGETSIDVENRYYSKFHATCGIPRSYEEKGHKFWRDIYNPSEILQNICNTSNLGQPVYEEDRIVIDNHEFKMKIPQGTDREEKQALTVLNRWQEMPIHGFQLVPEHVETRSLYHPALPGIERGKVQLWVDIFPVDFRFLPPKVDVTPQPPVAIELRAIIWNVVDVVLDDRSLLVNGRVSDIYLKGWMLSLEEEMQKTDIHYRSLNGEGNFNWRYIFHFDYMPSERKMLVKKKKDVFDKNPEERKVHCKLEIQVWDNDAFGDDYLGTLILELCAMPRGAKLSNRCTLKMLAPNASKINLFKIKKTRGWWPFRRLKMKESVSNEFELTGKLDLELEVLTQAEATQFPAGKGRQEPDPLPPPDRPDTSFRWLLNPIKTFRYIVWRRLRKILIISAFIILFAIFLLIALYAFPNYVVKKLVGA